MPTNGVHHTLQNWASLAPIVAHTEAVAFLEYDEGQLSCANKPVVLETAWTLIVNGQHWLTMLCTPTQLDYLVLGFLYNEGLIAGPGDVLDLRIGRAPETVIRVELRDRDVRLPQHRTLTSGCGGGITFVDMAAARDPVCSSFHVSGEQVSAMMSRMMMRVADEYHSVGGFHTAALSDGHQLLAIATDIGRHNTLDKLAGQCLSRGIAMHSAVLLTTGRVSADMLGKAARMRVPVVATLNSPTHLAIELAHQWLITLIGYARGSKMHIYTGWQRVSFAPIAAGVNCFIPAPVTPRT